MTKLVDDNFVPLNISEGDVVEAMKQIQGYIDITPGDFKEIYQAAFTLAIKRLFNSLTTGKIMTSPVITLDLGMTLVEATTLLAKKHISGGPVVDAKGLIVGVVSEKDFLRQMGFGQTPSFMQIATHCLNSRSCMIGRLHNKTVADVMTTPAITANPQTSINVVSTLFAKHRINRLPITDSNGRLAGIVTRTDLAHSFNLSGGKLQ